jgi:hypothetical protein
MKDLYFQQSPVDPGIYISSMRKNSEIHIFTIVYVDDIIVARRGSSWIGPLRAQLSQHLEIIYNGEANWCLGMGIIDINSDGSVKLHQSKYIHDMLYNFTMTDANPAVTPMLVSCDAKADSPPLSEETLYASLIGNLN